MNQIKATYIGINTKDYVNGEEYVLNLYGGEYNDGHDGGVTDIVITLSDVDHSIRNAFYSDSRYYKSITQLLKDWNYIVNIKL
jgi:hypothetical protein